MPERYLHAIDNVLSNLNQVSETDTGWTACCPAHGDTSPSLSITEIECGRVLLHCHAGCHFEDILESLEIETTDLVPNIQRGNRRNVITERFMPRRTPITSNYSVSRSSDFSSALSGLREYFGGRQAYQLAASLRFHPMMFVDFDLGWGGGCSSEFCAIPEFDHCWKPIGILRRFEDGSKLMAPGSRRGLVYSSSLFSHQTPVLVCEGFTDTVVLNASGFAAIGRPSNCGGTSLLVQMLEGSGRDIVVLGENDQKPDGSWPGRDGAERVAQDLQNSLNIHVPVIMPPEPFKDVRDMYHHQQIAGVKAWLTR